MAWVAARLMMMYWHLLGQCLAILDGHGDLGVSLLFCCNSPHLLESTSGLSEVTWFVPSFLFHFILLCWCLLFMLGLICFSKLLEFLELFIRDGWMVTSFGNLLLNHWF